MKFITILSTFIVLLGLSISSMAQVPSYVPSNGLVGWWPFNGNAKDESGNGNNGVVNGTTLATDRFGNVNTAYSFNGVNNYISLNTQLPNVFSVSLWVNVDAYKTYTLAGPNYIGSKLLSTIDNSIAFSGFEIGLDGLKTNYGKHSASFWCQSGCGYALAHKLMSIDNWYFLVATYDGSKLRYYVNGTLNIAITSSFVQNNKTIVLGARGFNLTGPVFFLDGKLDDFGIWNRSLTEMEVEELYNFQNKSTIADLGKQEGSETNNSKQKNISNSNAPGNIENDVNNSVTVQKLTKDRNGNRIFSDGSIYEGDRKKGKAEGQGKRTFSDGSVYEGQFLNGNYNGYGVFTDKDLNKYEGNFINGKREGNGKETFSKGEVYNGNWRNDSINGRGKYIYDNGNMVYNGSWQNGKREGYGELIFINGIIYYGNWGNDKYKGNGKLVYPNGVYEGNWNEGLRNGYGKESFPNGDSYEGDWANDKRTGKGICKYKDGNLYDGFWKNDKKNGKGVFKYKEGNVYDGYWENDKKNGYGKWTTLDGTVYEGDWVNGLKNGYGSLVNKKGDSYKGNWIADDFIIGKCTYKNGSVYNGDFKNGQPNGSGKLVYETGDIFEGTWDNGNMKKGTYTFNDGSIYTGDWNNNKFSNGRYTFKNGVVYEGSFADNRYSGYGKIYLENGDIYEGYWENNTYNGNGTFTKKTGEILTGNWKDGSLIEPTNNNTTNTNSYSSGSEVNTQVDPNRSKGFNNIINTLYPDDARFLVKVIDTYPEDSKHLCGKVCGTGYSRCKWCNKSIPYSKYYGSRVADFKAWSGSTDGFGALAAIMSPTISNIFDNTLLSAFSSVVSDSKPENSFRDAFKKELDKIRNNNIYYCEGNGKEFCSEKCKQEYIWAHGGYDNLR